MIPISLYVTMEIVKNVMKTFIDNDYAMYVFDAVCFVYTCRRLIDLLNDCRYHPSTNTAAEARTANLHEELGQVEYVFSDKTGATCGCCLTVSRRFIETEIGLLCDRYIDEQRDGADEVLY